MTFCKAAVFRFQIKYVTTKLTQHKTTIFSKHPDPNLRTQNYPLSAKYEQRSIVREPCAEKTVRSI